jgi:hypothetical protein
MDITFSCDGCGQRLTIDEAGAGITIDCPRCGKPSYVPSKPILETKTTPIRVEVGSAKPYHTPETAPQSVTYPVTSPYVNRKDDSIHPAIVGGLTCLLLFVACGFVGLVLMYQNPLRVMPLLYAIVPFATAAFLCAVYGICVGHVRHGALLIAGISLISVFGFFATMQVTLSSAGRLTDEMLKQQEEMLKQFRR